jgi:hypothetical protein
MMSTTSAASRSRRRAVSLTAALLLAGALAGVTACGDSSTGPRGGPAGNYSLRQVDGGNLPALVYNGPYVDADNNRRYYNLAIQVVGSTLELTRDGHFTLTIDQVANADGQVFSGSQSVEGYYEVDGDEVEFGSDDTNFPFTAGTLQNGTMTIGMYVLGGDTQMLFTYRR